MDLVDKKNRVLLLLEAGEDAFEARLEIAPEFRPREQRAHIQRIDHRILERVGNFAPVNLQPQPFGNCRFSDSRITDVDWIVLAAAAENVDRPLDLVVAADQRIDAALLRFCDQIHGKRFQRFYPAARFLFALFLFTILSLSRLFPRRDLRNSMGYKVHDVKARDPLLFEQVDRIGIGLAEHRDQQIAAVDFLLFRRLRVNHRPLQDAMEAQCLLRILFEALRKFRKLGSEEFLERFFERFDIAAAVDQRAARILVLEESVKQVLEANVFVPSALRLFQSGIESPFQFFADHCLSLFHCALQRILMLPGQALHNGYFGLSDFIGVNAGHTDTFFMDVKHDLNRLGLLFVEDVLQDLNNEFLGSIIVIVEQNFVKRRLLELLLGLGNEAMLQVGFPSAHAFARS